MLQLCCWQTDVPIRTCFFFLRWQEGGLCFKAGIRVGDFLLEINGEKVRNKQACSDLLFKAQGREGDMVKFTVRKGDGTIKPAEPKEVEPVKGCCTVS